MTYINPVNADDDRGIEKLYSINGNKTKYHSDPYKVISNGEIISKYNQLRKGTVLSRINLLISYRSDLFNCEAYIEYNDNTYHCKFMNPIAPR